MTRTTIDFGIDLGTTNSAIAVLDGTGVEVLRNNEGFEYTPSAVYLDKRGALLVGRAAKERLEHESDDAVAEFKLQMGTGHEYVFARDGRRLKPEELSAEVLKALREVAEKRGEQVRAAVITVPAAFELPQCEATQKAAKLAGLEASPLLPEPVAAAMAYGFQSASDRVFWLVYDLGGGTFDAAVVQLRDGVIEVVDHAGDNHLGGKLIDWRIVEELLIPAAVRERRLSGLERANPARRAEIAKLKAWAEEAKTRLSQDRTTTIGPEYLGQDDRGEPVFFEHELAREEVERLAEPIFHRSVRLAREVLERRELAAGDVERLLLVGGPTLMPALRELLADPVEGLGIPLELGVDPLTVVAKGAAVFAGTQLFTPATEPAASAGGYRIELKYSPVGADADPPVAGIVRPAAGGADLSGFTLELIDDEATIPWRSGKVALGADGTFFTSLFAEPGRRNTYRIELREPGGTPVATEPDRLVYTIGVVSGDQPLIHSVSIALADNTVVALVEKGTPLPVRKRSTHRAAFDLRRDGGRGTLRIPVVEGEHPRADRNPLIGALEISAADVRRDIPAGAEIEVTVEIDESRLVTTSAYVPLLDQTFEEVMPLKKPERSAQELTAEVERERERLETVRRQAVQTGEPGSQRVLDRIRDERMVAEVEGALEAARVDRDARETCHSRLLELRRALDQAETALEWPAAAAEAEEELRRLDEVARALGEPDDRARAEALEGELRRLLEERRDASLVRDKCREVSGLCQQVLQRHPSYWEGLLGQLRDMRSGMRDAGRAAGLFAQADRCRAGGDLPGLREAVFALIGLLPEERRHEAGFDSGLD